MTGIMKLIHSECDAVVSLFAAGPNVMSCAMYLERVRVEDLDGAV